MLNFVFSTTSFSNTSLNFLKSTRTAFNLQTSKSSTYVIELFKLVGTLAHLLMSSLSISAFTAIKSFLVQKSDVSMPVTWYNSFLTSLVAL